MTVIPLIVAFITAVLPLLQDVILPVPSQLHITRVAHHTPTASGRQCHQGFVANALVTLRSIASRTLGVQLHTGRINRTACRIRLSSIIFMISEFKSTPTSLLHSIIQYYNTQFLGDVSLLMCLATRF
jgi:hypothetical protein